MTNFKKITISLTAVIALNFNGCGGGETTISKFDTATQMNLSELQNYDLITGDGSGATNLRSVGAQNNSNTISPDNASLKLSNILKDTVKNLMQNAETKKQRSLTVNGNIATLTETNNGNISGTQKINFQMNKATGKLTGSMTYSNYKNSESDSCSGNEIVNLNGTMRVTGIFDTSNFDLKTMTININSNFSMDDMIWVSGASMTITYDNFSSFEEDSLMTMTIEATKGGESIGFKNYKIRSYYYNGYEYSYPIEGDIYIFTNDINGYFSVDTAYDHSSTPTKEDFCGEYIYSGKEKYIGKDSSLTWEITSTNNYKIEVDSNNDGIIDINETGKIGYEF